MNIVLGITGSIAAYKAADIANILTKEGHNIDVIMTASAQKFITPLTFQTLTKRRVYTDMFDEICVEDVRHISLAKKTDLVLIAPASADFIGRLAAGIADDMLTTVLLAVEKKPIIICPAMNTAMLENLIVKDNIKKLQSYGYIFVESKEGHLACGDLGRGALASVNVILDVVRDALRVNAP